MPVFTDVASSSRDLRVLPSFAPPLPRLSPPPAKASSEPERYEAVVVGAGPAGLFLTLLLARYGLTDDSLLCIDAKPGSLKSGQADGLQPRTLEVFKSLGLAEEILTQGCQMWEVGFWNPSESGDGIERTAHVPDVAVPARFPHEVTIHQGRIERILLDDLLRYSKRGVEYSTKLVSAEIDEEGDAEFPVVAVIEKTTGEGSTAARRTIRAKHLVGADGAHSAVRRAMGLRLEGEARDHIWGVVDLVVDSNFPDIRRRSAIHSSVGSVMVIPRERIATGDYLTRLYVQIDEQVPPDTSSQLDDPDADEILRKERAKAQRAKVTLEGILGQAKKVLHPYTISQKADTDVDWWAAYQIGQRMTSNFAMKDNQGVPRLFIAGDACHTHSPKAGQGMNVSMMDSYNLAWKLMYHLNGLTATETPDLLDTYESERQEIARELIEFDTKFSTMFSGQIGASADGSAQGLTHEQFLEVFSTGNGFTSGCGIEYPASGLVQHAAPSPDASAAKPTETELLSGVWRPGRRLLNVRLIRHADGNPRDLHDDLPSTARFRILLLTSTDLLNPDGRSATALASLATTLSLYPHGLVELVALHPLDVRKEPWESFPPQLKQLAEMRFYAAGGVDVPAGKGGWWASEDAYTVYGISRERGGVCVVRPDGYVGLVAGLEDVGRVERYLGEWLRRVG